MMSVNGFVAKTSKTNYTIMWPLHLSTLTSWSHIKNSIFQMQMFSEMVRLVYDQCYEPIY